MNQQINQSQDKDALFETSKSGKLLQYQINFNIGSVEPDSTMLKKPQLVSQSSSEKLPADFMYSSKQFNLEECLLKLHTIPCAIITQTQHVSIKSLQYFLSINTGCFCLQTKTTYKDPLIIRILLHEKSLFVLKSSGYSLIKSVG